MESITMKVLAVDPGINGAFVLTDGKGFFKYWQMPVTVSGKDKSVHFQGVQEILGKVGTVHVYLERAMPMAQGMKQAFSYGRGFEALVIAINLSGLPVTFIEPSKWTKEMHEGISSDLKPKAKSLIAVQRLFPKLVMYLPKKPKGGLADGPIDALLMAGYALRKMGIKSNVEEVPDFY
jgi:hypothetical protein